VGRVTNRYRVVRMADGVAASRPDTLAAEEPLEIRVAGRPLTVTMRTPGDDFDLARGFLVSEGVVSADSDIVAIRYCAGATANGVNTYNVLDVLLDDGVPPPDPSLERNFYTTSSCGLCGKASLEAVRTISKWPVDRDPLRLNAATIATMPEKLRAAQRVFDRTGGLHAAALFDADGDLLCVREDVGRHNAVDKVIGWALDAGRLPLSGTTLMVSGRASFELVQKAVMAGVPALAAVSAPSSLAVDLAREMGLTLIGFLRGSSMNIYSGVERIPSDHDAGAYTGQRQAI
jgi:FdhD protein